MIEVIDEVGVVLLRFHSRFRMGNAFDKIVTQDNDGREKLLCIGAALLRAI